MSTLMKVTRWTYQCWAENAGNDIEQLLGNAYKTRQDLLDGRENPNRSDCNCGQGHKPMQIFIKVRS